MAPPKSGGMQALAAMCSHVPNKGEQMARYYGFYSNVARGKRKILSGKTGFLYPKSTIFCRF
jgi:hypothetical protein